jgi:hypothetical protein
VTAVHVTAIPVAAVVVVAVLLYWHLGDCCWLEVALVTSAEMDPLQLWDEQLTRVMSLSLGDELVSAVIVVAAVNVVR